MLDISSVTVALSGRTIISGVTCTAEAGSLTAIIGPNGSGKSTLLKAICGEHAYSGNISLNGKNLRQQNAMSIASQRAVLPQQSSLPFPYTVREVVAMGTTAGRPGPTGAALRTLPEQALAMVDLTGFGARFYGDLSGGEQQRVQLARVLCQVWQPVLDGTPRFLFLDEPVSSLDIKHQLIVMDVAKNFANAGGGVVTVLHDLNLAAMYADKIIALSGGQMIANGSAQAVLTDSTIRTVFDTSLRVCATPSTGCPFVLPQSVGANGAPSMSMVS